MNADRARHLLASSKPCQHAVSDIDAVQLAWMMTPLMLMRYSTPGTILRCCTPRLQPQDPQKLSALLLLLLRRVILCLTRIQSAWHPWAASLLGLTLCNAFVDACFGKWKSSPFSDTEEAEHGVRQCMSLCGTLRSHVRHPQLHDNRIPTPPSPCCRSTGRWRLVSSHATAILGQYGRLMAGARASALASSCRYSCQGSCCCAWQREHGGGAGACVR